MGTEETHFVACKTQEYYSEFRLDPLTERWALIAEGRGKRPSNIEARVVEHEQKPCPDHVDKNCAFCPGNERVTTETVASVVRHDPNYDSASPDDYDVVTAGENEHCFDPRWSARVIENKFPAFRIPKQYVPPVPFDELRRRFRAGELPASERFFQRIEAVGRHEVIVDVRRHVRGWGEMTEREIALAFRLIQSRLREQRASGRFNYAFFFKNVGINAGASQPHSHCQLTANATIPDDVHSQLERVAVYEKNRKAAGEKGSFWDALLSAELAAGQRVVKADEHFVLYCPYASRFPMQSEICPRFDGPFEDYGKEKLYALAYMARHAIRALQAAHARFAADPSTPVDYNVLMTNEPYRTAPELEDAASVFRPRLTILPSLVKKAGYELGSGIDINPVSPETAAERLREYFNQ